MEFKEIIENSRSIRRFIQIENMDCNEFYEFFFECYCAFLETFKERLKYGREINRVLKAYRDIDAFKVGSPKELIDRMFNSGHMQIWFAYRFWAEADLQVRNKIVDRDGLLLSLSFTNAIPTTQLMEEIFNEPKDRGGRGPENRKAKAGRETTAIAE